MKGTADATPSGLPSDGESGAAPAVGSARPTTRAVADPDLDDWMRSWREDLLGVLRSRKTDTVVVTHYVAINVAVGHATGADRVISFAPDYCSDTELELTPGGIRVVRLGREAQTRVR